MPLRTTPYLINASLREDIPINFRAYPFNIPAVRDIAQIEFHPCVTFFVGENGTGKSTILEAIALILGFSAEGGTRNVQFSTTSSVSELHESMRLARSGPKPFDGYFLRAESFFNVATYMDDVSRDDKRMLAGYGGKSLHERSHGEAFLALLINKLKGHGLYLMDEPEAALSPGRQLAALRAIHELVIASSQFVIATHSPILLSYPNAKIIRFSESGVNEIKYEDTEHYSVTRDFLNNYPRRLQQLLEEDEGE